MLVRSSVSVRIGTVAFLLWTIGALPASLRAQERTTAMVPSAGGLIQVRIAQGNQIAVTVEKNGRPSFSALLAPEQAVHLAAALKEAADSAVARRGPSHVTQTVAPQTYFAFEVDRPAEVLPGTLAPVYPASLEGHNVSGEVDAMVVVDTSGLAIPGTLRILRATNELFAASFKSALPSARFSAATRAGVKVRQLVSLKFPFAVPR